jgi:hypothetical protein
MAHALFSKNVKAEDENKQLCEQQQQPEKIDAPLERGARVRVKYDISRDYFREEPPIPYTGDWFLGTVVTNTEKKVTIRFDCWEEAVDDSDSPYIEAVYEDESAVYTRDGSIFCELQPRRLKLGDLVFARYQNGCKFFRGRVARVGLNRAGTSVCDVAYDDGEYETNIPYGDEHQGNIRKVQDDHAADWMIGLQVRLPAFKVTDVTVYTIEAVGQGGLLVLVAHIGRGETFLQECEFETVVSKLFEQHKPTQGLFHWPTTQQVMPPVAAVSLNATNGFAIQQIDSKTNHIIKTFPSVRKAVEATKISRGSLYGAVKKQAEAGGFLWRKVGVNKPVSSTESCRPMTIAVKQTKNKVDNRLIPIEQIDLDTNMVVQSFPSIVQAAKATKIQRIYIGQAVKTHGICECISIFVLVNFTSKLYWYRSMTFSERKENR